jgi:predicted cupin superfamily sugar epimerase/uncharacterized protein YciI
MSAAGAGGAGGPGGGGPRTFLVTRVPGAGWIAGTTMREQRAWEPHAAFMDAAHAAGLIRLGGPRGETGEVQLVVEASDEAEVRTRLAEDPWEREGILVTTDVVAWALLLDRHRRPTADEVIAALGLQPHPEGGWYVETWRDPAPEGERPAGSAIYYLLRSGEHSRWHRVDATETWHHYAGDPLELRIADAGGQPRVVRLGPDLADGERPQAVVPVGAWQAARSLGAWTLVGCTVAPAFEFAGFELAPEGWEPG